MNAWDVLIVGGGPAGSACARALTAAGLATAILDKATFPRDKVCGGWITPQTVDELALDLDDYRSGRTLQRITGFAVGVLGEPLVRVDYGRTVSYAIRRCEFDDYLLRRSGAVLRLGEPVESLERVADGWLVNGALRARLLVGAGGHGCPVARQLGRAAAASGEPIAGQEIEYALAPDAASACTARLDAPVLIFCRDLRGYGWCVRKGGFVNIGLGRIGSHGLAEQALAFWDYLGQQGLVTGPLPARFKGHAYLSYRASRRTAAAEAAVLIGDAAGLADSRSGEGIREAVESGLLAAEAIVAADGDYRQARLSRYASLLTSRFGPRIPDPEPASGPLATARTAISHWLLARPSFVRAVVLDRWFLHRRLGALEPAQPREPLQVVAARG